MRRWGFGATKRRTRVVRSSAPPPVQPASTKFVRAVAAGAGDGSSWANAAPFANIPALIAASAPDGVVALYSGDVFPASILALAACGGTPGHPVTVMGMDGLFNPEYAVIDGSRTPFDFPAEPTVTQVGAWASGNALFQITAALGNLSFKYLEIREVSVPFNVNHTAGTVTNLVFQHLRGRNTRYFVDHANGQPAAPAPGFAIDGITFDDIDLDGYSKNAVRLRGKDPANAARNITFNNIHFNSHRQDGDSFAEGLTLDGWAYNVTWTNCTGLNHHDSQGGNQANYWNGDSFPAEELHTGLLFVDCTATGNTDAGWDLKSSAVLIRPVSGDNKRLWKFWNADFDVQNPVISAPPNKRGGTGSPCILNINQNTAGACPHVRVTNADFRLNGQVGAFEIDFDSGLNNNAGAVVKYINVQRDAVPALNNSGAHIRYMIAAAAPVGAITLTTSSANLLEGTGNSIAISTNRDAAHGGVIIRSISGPDAALFQIDGLGGVGHHAQSISPAAPIAWTGTGADAKSITLNVEDIAGNTAALPFAVNVTHDTTDHRVLDVTFAGADNTAVATDVSPAAHTLIFGSACKIRTTDDPAGSLRINFTANGTGTGRLTSADSPDWLFNTTATIIARAKIDAAATALVQQILCQWNNTTGGRSWRLYFDATGHPTFEISADGSSTAFVLADPTARNNGQMYDLKVTREFLNGTTYRWKLWVDGAAVASTDSTAVPLDVTQILAVGATSSSRDYMAGFVKRVAIYKGSSSGA